MKVEKIFVSLFSSKYGESNNSFGQPLGVKSIAIISVKSSNGIIRSHELYLGIYIPEIIETIVQYISPLYINEEINEKNIFKGKDIPFVTNSGIFKSIKGAIESCILQLIFFKQKITLVDGLKKLMNENIRRNLFDNKIKYYASGGSVSFSPNECIDDAIKSLKSGFNGFKMRCGYQDFNADIKRVKSVRAYIDNQRIIDKDFYLMVDFIQGTLKSIDFEKKIINYFHEFSDLKVLWIEEPLDPDNYELYKNLPKNILLKSCLGESFTSFNEYIPFANNINRFQIDVTHIGGFLEAIKVLNYFSRYSENTKFTSHVWGSKLSLLTNLALCRATSSIEWFEIPLLEFEINHHLFKSKEFDPKIISDEEIDVLISELNLEKDKKYEFKPGSGYRI